MPRPSSGIQLRGVQHIHRAVQPAPPSVPGTRSSPPHPLKLCPHSLPRPWCPPSPLCLCECGGSRDLTGVTAPSPGPSVSGFHSASGARGSSTREQVPACPSSQGGETRVPSSLRPCWTPGRIPAVGSWESGCCEHGGANIRSGPCFQSSGARPELGSLELTSCVWLILVGNATSLILCEEVTRAV